MCIKMIYNITTFISECTPISKANFNNIKTAIIFAPT